MIKILLIEDLESEIKPITKLLTTDFESVVTRVDSLLDAVKVMESAWIRPDLIICDDHGSSFTPLSRMLELSQGVPCILIVDDPTKFSEFRKIKQAFLTEPVARKHLTRDLLSRIENLEEEGMFVHLAKDGSLDPRSKKIITVQEQKVQKLIETPKPNIQTVHNTTTNSIKLIQEVTSKIGFTPQVQAIATKSVELTLKVIADSPKLSEILKTLKTQEGKFIASHSMMLAEIASALASQMEWSSGATFTKLCLAAFLHDLTLTNNELARCRTLEEAKALPGITQYELNQFKLHPTHAAELARKFHEIPADVDTIIAQHHELPGGTGFPRGLFQSQISPLTCVFIVAEDLLHFYLDRDFRADALQFVKERENIYVSGNLRRALKVLENESTAMNKATSFS